MPSLLFCLLDRYAISVFASLSRLFSNNEFHPVDKRLWVCPRPRLFPLSSRVITPFLFSHRCFPSPIPILLSKYAVPILLCWDLIVKSENWMRRKLNAAVRTRFEYVDSIPYRSQAELRYGVMRQRYSMETGGGWCRFRMIMENVAKRRQGKPSAEPRRQSESSADVMSYGSINHPEANSLFRHWATTLSRGGG
jgi:hypothetical protein